MSAFERQEDGNHYAKLAIQPMQYSMANNLDACQHTIIKYVTRFRDKNGRTDLEKAKHVIDMLIELEYGNSEQAIVWIDWHGGNCPVGHHAMVDIKTRDGAMVYGEAGYFGWLHIGEDSDIVAYRVVKD